MNATNAVAERQLSLTPDVAALLALLSPVILQNLQASVSQMRQMQRGQDAAVHTGQAQNEARELDLLLEDVSSDRDSVEPFEEEILEDGNVRRRYRNGTVRVENPRSGIIQEDRHDGSLIVSMPDGHVLFQQFLGEPLLVYNLNEMDQAPHMANVARVHLGGGDEQSLVYTFRDQDGTHLVEFDSLRYFRHKSPQPTIAVAA